MDSKIDKQTYRDLCHWYGKDTVHDAITLVQMSDADGAYVLCLDYGKDDMATIIEELFFN